MNSPIESVVTNHKISKTDKLLVILWQSPEPLSVTEVRSIAAEHGWRQADKENFGAFLRASKYATKLRQKWKLNSHGRAYLEKKGLIKEEAVITPVIAKLEATINDIADNDSKRFLGEALECLKMHAYRSAIVLCWVGAIFILQKIVFESYIEQFNKQLIRKFPKSSLIENFEDFLDIKESKFLDVIYSAQIISERDYKLLKSCLDYRNEAGHPNSTIFDELETANHISNLSKIVFSKIK